MTTLADRLTAAAVVTTLHDAGFRVLVDTDEMVVADRRIPSLALADRFALRRVIAADNGNGTWRVRMFFATPYPEPTRRRLYEHTLVCERHACLDALDFGLWLGGACSVPYSDGERRAIEAGIVA